MKSVIKSRVLSVALGVAVGFGACFPAPDALGIDKDTARKLRLQAINAVKYALPVNGLNSSMNRGDNAGQYLGATSSRANLGCTPGLQDAVRGLTVGCTFFDFQRNGSMNRMIVTDEPTHILNFTWTNQDNNSATGDHKVRYEGFDPQFGLLSDGTGGAVVMGCGIAGCTGSSGVPSLDTRGSNGLAVIANHWKPPFGLGEINYAWTSYNVTPSLADFVAQIIDTSAINSLMQGNATEFKWPRVACTNDGSGTEVTHLLLNSNRTDADPRILYTRKVGSGPAGTWDSPIEVGAGGFHLSGAITASRKAGSQKVVIAAALGRGDGTQFGGFQRHFNGQVSGQFDNDIFFMESSDAGATWGPLTNVTLRPDSLGGHLGDDGFAPGAKLDVLYDQNDVFHIVWQAAVWNGYSGPFTTQGRLFHYDPLNDKIRIVHDFVWDQTRCNGGLFNLNATNPQISECDNKLYVTFEQFNDMPNGIDDDCNERAPLFPAGAANGDIFVTVSDNGGLNWDLKRNLTATYTPDCDTVPGGARPDCDSDVWHSTTRYGIDIDVNLDDFDAIADLSGNIGGYVGPNYLFVQYINDANPGGAINAEGSWTNNGLKVFRFGCVEKVSNCPVVATSVPIGQIVDDPAFVRPGEDSVLAWSLTNIGNSPANYSITISNDSPPGNITLTGAPLSGVISEGDPNFVTFLLTLNANLETEVQHAHAEFDIGGDFVEGSCGTGPLHFVVDYTIGNLELRKIDTLANLLVFSNQGGVGLQGNNGQNTLTMDFQNKSGSSECDTTGNADNYLFDGSPIISYNSGIVVTSMFSNSIVDSFQFRPLTAPSTDDVSDPDWYIGNSGQFTTQDSTLCFAVDYFSPKSTLFSNPDWNLVYTRVCYYNNTAAPIDSVFCAYGWDWDVPSDTGARNTSTIIPQDALIAMSGAEYGQDTGNTACLPNDQRWAASMYVPNTLNGLPDYTDGGSGAMASGFQALYTRDNASYVGGDWDHAKLDTALHTISDFARFSSAAPDSQEVDLHMVLNGGAYRLDPDDSLYLWFIMVTGIGTQADFDECVSIARTLAPPVTPAWNIPCCKVAGDYNGDGVFNIGDVTSAINFIFCPIDFCPPPSCQDQADVNGDNSFNIADITSMIARIFSGGPAPVCGTTGH